MNSKLYGAMRLLSLPERYDPGWSRKFVIKRRPDVDTRSTTFLVDFSSVPDDNGRIAECIFWLTHALIEWAADKQPGTVKERAGALRHFFRFLCERAQSVKHLKDIDEYVLDILAAWLREDPEMGTILRRRIWAQLGILMRVLQDSRPGLVREDLRFRRFSSLKDQRTLPEKDVLTQKEVGKILLACRQHIEAFRSVRANAEAAMKLARTSYSVRRAPDFSSYGQVLLWLDRCYRKRKLIGKGRTVTDLLTANVIVHRRFGCQTTKDLYRCITILHSDLAPYLILIAAYSGANTASLLRLDVTCLEAPPRTGPNVALATLSAALVGDRDHLYWDKHRSDHIQSRSFPRDRDFLPPALVREMIILTEPIRPLVNPDFQDKLFLVDAFRRGVIWLREDALGSTLGGFQQQYNLPHFTIGSLRDAMINYGYLAANGNIAGAQRLANHRSAETTRRHYLAGPARRANDQLLAKLHLDLIKWLKSGTTIKSACNEASTTPVENAQIKAWIAAFGDVQHIICGDVERVGRILQMRAALIAARTTIDGLRWQAVYAPLFALLNDRVIPVLDPVAVEAAQRLPQLMPLPSFE